jgi:tight adherence protein C
MILFFLAGVALAGLSVALVVRSVAFGRVRSRAALAQIGAYGFDASVLSVSEARRARGRNLLGELASRLGASVERQLGKARQREVRTLLNSAGFYRTTVARYLGYRVIVGAGAPTVFALFSSANGSVGLGLVLAVAALAAVGWILPPFVVKRRARARTEAIDYEVPELVDLLVTTIEAGVGFAAALQISARRTRGALGEELRVALREQSMGLTIDEALRNMLERTSTSISLRAFVQAIIQGESLGVSIGKILRDLAVDMRKRRRQIAEERAQKAPTKLLFPLVFLILPAMFIVILGPAFQAMGNAFG